jgi:hypothetical protein
MIRDLEIWWGWRSCCCYLLLWEKVSEVVFVRDLFLMLLFLEKREWVGVVRELRLERNHVVNELVVREKRVSWCGEWLVREKREKREWVVVVRFFFFNFVILRRPRPSVSLRLILWRPRPPVIDFFFQK